MENLHARSELRCNVFMTDTVPSAEFVRTAFLWDATEDTPSITGIPPHTTLLAKIKNLRLVITDQKVTLKEDIKVILKDELDTREVGGAGFVQSNPILSKLDNMMQQQTDQLTELRANQNSIPLAVSPPPSEHDTESDLVLIVEEDADEIIAHNIKKNN